VIGKVQIRLDKRPHCTNGWGPTRKFPACSYTGGHYCKHLLGHRGRCRCTCGSVTRRKPPRDE
jgi:hypothetical protein